MRCFAAFILMIVIGMAGEAGAEPQPIDAGHSTLTIYAYSSGLLSAFGDDHVIRAPVAGGTISDEAPLAAELTVRPADFVVLDPSLSPAKRAEVRERMLSAEVLDSTRFPEITFRSTAVEPAGPDRWSVRGTLTVRGATRPVVLQVARPGGRYRGTVNIKQSEFGIRPIRIAAGTVRVKDELKIEFDIVPAM